MNNKKEKLGSTALYSAGLFLAALLWGMSYPATKAVEDCPTFFILPLRFMLASVILIVCFRSHLRNITWRTVKSAIIISLITTIMYVFATVGIKYTLSARASFFTCLTFIFVPVMNRLIFGQRIGRIVVSSMLMCLVGIFFMSYTPGSAELDLNIGDILCVGGSISGSLEVILVERETVREDFDAIQFTTLLMMFGTLWTTLAGVGTGAFRGMHLDLRIILMVALLGIFCNAIAYLLQTICQKYIPANRAGVIFALEPASGCILSVIFMGEKLGLVAWIGAAIVLYSSIYIEVASRKK